MTKEQKEAIDRIKYNDIAMPLYCGDMTICNIDDLKTILSMLEEQENKIKQLGKGQHTLMQSRRKWKYRYYKMKNKNKEQDKIIDLMASEILKLDIKRANSTYDKSRIWETEKGIRQYFENKAKEVE